MCVWVCVQVSIYKKRTKDDYWKDEEVWQGSLSSTSTQIKIDVIYFSLNEFTLIFRITRCY